MQTIHPIALRHSNHAMANLLVFLAFCLCLSAQAGTVTASYANDFTSATSDLTFAAEARWFHVPAQGVYSNEYKSATGTAGTTLGNLGGPADDAKPFTVAADFTFINGNGTGSFIGLCFLSGAESLPAVDGYTFYQVIATPSGTTTPLALKRNNVVVTNGPSFTQIRYAKGTPLRFVVKGVYVDTNADGVNDALDITASIENPATGSRSTITYRDPAPLTGKAFGMKDYDANNVVSAVLWDSFAVSNDTPRGTVMTVR